MPAVRMRWSRCSESAVEPLMPLLLLLLLVSCFFSKFSRMW